MKARCKYLIFIFLFCGIYSDVDCQKVDLQEIQGWCENHILSYYALINNCLDHDLSREDKFYIKQEILTNYVENDYTFQLDKNINSLDFFLESALKENTTEYQFSNSSIEGPYYNPTDDHFIIIIAGEERVVNQQESNKERKYYLKLNHDNEGRITRSIKIVNKNSVTLGNISQEITGISTKGEKEYFEAMNSHFQGDILNYRRNISKAKNENYKPAHIFDLRLKFIDWYETKYYFDEAPLYSDQEIFNECRPLLDENYPEAAGLIAPFYLQSFSISEKNRPTKYASETKKAEHLEQTCRYLNAWAHCLVAGKQYDDPLSLFHIANDYLERGSRANVWSHLYQCEPVIENTKSLHNDFYYEFDPSYRGTEAKWDQYIRLMDQAIKNNQHYYFIELEYFSYLFARGPKSNKKFVAFMNSRIKRSRMKELQAKYLKLAYQLPIAARRYYSTFCPDSNQHNNHYDLKIDQGECTEIKKIIDSRRYRK